MVTKFNYKQAKQLPILDHCGTQNTVACASDDQPVVRDGGRWRQTRAPCVCGLADATASAGGCKPIDAYIALSISLDSFSLFVKVQKVLLCLPEDQKW